LRQQVFGAEPVVQQRPRGCACPVVARIPPSFDPWRTLWTSGGSSIS
jgi:hypothetical protein